jgi:hypothetical protein
LLHDPRISRKICARTGSCETELTGASTKWAIER